MKERTEFLEDWYETVKIIYHDMGEGCLDENIGYSIEDIQETAICLTFEELLNVTIADDVSLGMYKALKHVKPELFNDQIWAFAELLSMEEA